MTSLPPRPGISSSFYDPTKRLRPRTYTVAVFLVGAVLVLEIVMVISVFILRNLVVPVGTNPELLVKKPVTPPNLNTNTVVASLPNTPPPDLSTTTAVTGTQAGDLPMLAAPVIRPALLTGTVSERLQAIGNLNDQAENSLHINDLQQAEVTLLKAEALDPRNPSTLKNLALTYDAMNDPVRAKIFWQRVSDLGPGVGSVYSLAQDHVALLNSSADSDPLHQPSTLPRYVYIQSVEKTPIDTQNGIPQFHLKTVLGRKDQNAPFSQKLLRPFVIFYLKMSTGELQPDLHQGKGSFENTFLFWNKSRREAFNVDYIMPAPNADSSAGDYYGFIIGIYYDNVLQDQRSEPSDLINREPLPTAIE